MNIIEEQSPKLVFHVCGTFQRSPCVLPLNTVREMEAFSCELPELLPHTLKLPP